MDDEKKKRNKAYAKNMQLRRLVGFVQKKSGKTKKDVKTAK